MRGFRVPGVLAAFAIGLASSCEGAERRHSVSGENECYDIVDQQTCEAETLFLCRWEGMSCFPDCESYDDQSSCDDDDSCQWNGSACGLNES